MKVVLRKRLWLLLSLTILIACSIQASPSDQGQSKAVQTALEYFRLHEHELGLDIPGMELRVLHETRRPVKNGEITIVRFAQYFRSVPIYGAEAVVDVNEAAGVVAISDSIVRSVAVDVVPRVASNDMVAEAEKRILPAKPLKSSKAILEILAMDRVPGGLRLHRDALVWYVPVTLETGEQHDFFFDAHSGELLWSYDATGRARSFFSWSTSVSAFSMFNGEWHVAMNVDTHGVRDSTTNWTYYLQMPCEGVNVVGGYCTDLFTKTFQTWDPAPRGNWVGDAGNLKKTTGSYFTSPTRCAPGVGFCGGVFGDSIRGSANRSTAAADAFIGMDIVWHDVLLDMFNRSGLDDKDSLVYGLVHYGSGYLDGTWCASCPAILLGDGNVNDPLNPTYPFVSLDIVGHEMGHGLNDFTARLPSSGEGGGIRESNADILGTIAELKYWEASPDPVAANYLIGERLFTDNWRTGRLEPTRAIRNMSDPGFDGHSPACWSSSISSLGDVHYIAGPSNHMFWLLAHGGTSACNGSNVLGIGWRDAAQIWYGALLRMTPTTTYSELRQRYLDSSASAYGLPSVQTATVTAAFAGIDLP